MSAESLIELDELSESMLEKLKHLKPMPVQLRVSRPRILAF